MSRLEASEVLNTNFLEVRAKLLEIAAVLDRIDRAATADAARQDPRYQKLQRAIDILQGDLAAVEVGRDTADGQSRAELIQLLFSRPYDATWPETLQVARSER